MPSSQILAPQGSSTLDRVIVLDISKQPCLYFFCKTYPQYSERLLQIPRTFAWTVLQNTIGARWRELCLVQLHAGRTASNRLQTTLVHFATRRDYRIAGNLDPAG